MAFINLLETRVSGREVDRRVLVTDIGAELELITCVWDRIGQMARRSTPERSCTGFYLIRKKVSTVRQ